MLECWQKILAIIVVAMFTWLTCYQDVVIRQQRELIRSMTKSPACMIEYDKLGIRKLPAPQRPVIPQEN